MRIVSRSPRHPALAGLVETLWWTDSAPGAAGRRERVLPSGRAQLIVSCGDDHTADTLVGPRSEPADLDDQGRRRAGAVFTAGGLVAFVEAPADALIDAMIPLDEICRFEWCAERADGCDGPAVLDQVERELLRLLSPERTSPAALAAANAIRSGAPAGDIASRLGTDRRVLVPEFRRAVGFGLKHYERIERFQATVRAIRRRRPGVLAAIAAGLGYSDQAHLTREFTHFAGMSPSRLLGDDTPATNHVDRDKLVPDPGASPAR